MKFDMKKIKYLPINWTNGIKLSSDHFVHTYYASIEQLQALSSRITTPFNYGLGDTYGSDREAVYLTISGDSPSTMRVELHYCSGITESGHTIIYSKELYGESPVQSSLLENATYDDGNLFYVIVSIDPYKMMPVGQPDPSVEPLHHPYALPEVKLHLLPASQINIGTRGTDFLIVGMLEYRNGLLIAKEQYIPPIQRLAYSPKAMECYHTLISMLQRINGYTKLIYRKNIRDSRRTKLVDNTFILCDAFTSFYNQYIFELTEIVPQMSPIQLFQAIQVMGQEILSALMRMDEREYEALLQYCYTWTDITPAELENQLSALASLRYSHISIHSGLDVILCSVRTIEKVFSKLSDLEYVGLLRENIIISEETEESESKKQKSWKIIG